MVKKYKNGLTVVVEENPGLRSVTAGIMVASGSAYETNNNNGISHFIEHMLFKGTKKRSAEEIVSAFDECGAAYNAFTGKEYTCFYFKSIDEKTEDCFDVLADIFLHSEFGAEELDRERNVILEEINMSLDEPDGVCYDVLFRTAFSGSLAMEVLGTKENVQRFNKQDIEAYMSGHYLPSNTVVAFVGNITAEKAFSLVEKYLAEFVSRPFAPPPVYEVQQFRAGYGAYIHNYEQSEISIAYPSIALSFDASPLVSAIDCVMGTSMSSRLFQRIREKLGLCYSIYTQPWMGKTCGTFSVCANVNVANAEKCVAIIREEIGKVVDAGFDEREVERAKMQLKVNALFGKENPMNYMLALLRWQLQANIEYDLDRLIGLIENIDKPSMDALAREIFSAPPAIAYAGKAPGKALDKVYNKE